MTWVVAKTAWTLVVKTAAGEVTNGLSQLA